MGQSEAWKRKKYIQVWSSVLPRNTFKAVLSSRINAFMPLCDLWLSVSLGVTALSLPFKGDLQEPPPVFAMWWIMIYWTKFQHISGLELGKMEAWVLWLATSWRSSCTAGSDPPRNMPRKSPHRPDPVICMSLIHKFHSRHRTPRETTPRRPVCTNSQTEHFKNLPCRL